MLKCKKVKLKFGCRFFCDRFIYISKEKFQVKPSTEIKINKEGVKITELTKKKGLFKFLFIPVNYPHSVREEYLSFAFYSFCGGSTYYLMNFLSTQALINSLDFSYNSSLFITAGMSFALKEGLGQIGATLFTGLFGYQFENSVKKWRLIAINMFNIAFLLESLSMIFPHKFILIASIASLCKYKLT
jgi:hypothetical protein